MKRRPAPLHRSRKERSIQKGSAYKVPGAEAPGQKGEYKLLADWLCSEKETTPEILHV